MCPCIEWIFWCHPPSRQPGKHTPAAGSLSAWCHQ